MVPLLLSVAAGIILLLQAILHRHHPIPHRRQPTLVQDLCLLPQAIPLRPLRILLLRPVFLPAIHQHRQAIPLPLRLIHRPLLRTLHPPHRTAHLLLHIRLPPRHIQPLLQAIHHLLLYQGARLTVPLPQATPHRHLVIPHLLQATLHPLLLISQLRGCILPLPLRIPLRHLRTLRLRPRILLLAE